MTALLVAALVAAVSANVSLVGFVADRLSREVGTPGAARPRDAANRNAQAAVRLAA